MSTRDVRIDWHGISLLVEIEWYSDDSFDVNTVNTVSHDWALLDELHPTLLSQKAEQEILAAVRAAIDKEQEEAAREPREPQYEREYNVPGGLYR